MPSSPVIEIPLPTIADVRAAALRLDGIALRTPLLESEAINTRAGGRVLLKCEMFQPMGAFKIRGAWNRIVRIPLDERARGVVAYSSGNHAQAVALAARTLGMPATVVMPSDAPGVKIDRTRGYGAEIVLYDRETEDREALAARIVARTGATVVPPYDHPDIVAGQGTVGLELAAQCAERGIVPDIVAVPCGGGGLVAGCAIALRDAWPDVAVYAAEPVGFDDTARSLAAGMRVANAPGAASICDALLVPTPGALTFEINRRLLSGGLVVSDDEVRSAMKAAWSDARLVVEPGGATGLAALLERRVDLRGRTACVVLSGGNAGADLFAAAISEG
ncbi:MAG: threonine/serine dehydratase [Rhodospirillaceae bacterium]